VKKEVEEHARLEAEEQAKKGADEKAVFYAKKPNNSPKRRIAEASICLRSDRGRIRMATMTQSE
jgi:hypothetical protein